MALREESGTWPTRRRAMPGVAPEAGQAGEGQIRLHREPGLGGEVLAGHEERRPSLVRVPQRAARAVEEGLVEALARLARHAAVAGGARLDEGLEVGVRLVDDDR